MADQYDPPSAEPLATAASDKQEPYFIEVDTNGCSYCGAGRTWWVIGPNGEGSSQSWSEEEDAQAYADAMNEAFWRGRTEPSQI